MPTEALLDHAVDQQQPPVRRRNVARILLVDSDLASRLTLGKLLSTAGYAVEGAASAAEAVAKLDSQQFQLVLADLGSESEDAGARVIAYARQKESRPATALISSRMSEMDTGNDGPFSSENIIRMSNEDVSNLLVHVAELISQRADRRMRRSLNGNSKSASA